MTTQGRNESPRGRSLEVSLSRSSRSSSRNSQLGARKDSVTRSISSRSTSPSDKASPKEMARLGGQKKFEATPERLKAFAELKRSLSIVSVLIHPDFTKRFILYMDTCRKGIAGILQQIWDEDGKEHLVLFISRVLKQAERNYSSTEIEYLVVVWCLEKFEHYLDGVEFTIYTNHFVLKWIWGMKEKINARLFKWSLFLNSFRDKIIIIHRSECFHINVDLSFSLPKSSLHHHSYHDRR